MSHADDFQAAQVGCVPPVEKNYAVAAKTHEKKSHLLHLQEYQFTRPVSLQMGQVCFAVGPAYSSFKRWLAQCFAADG